MTLAARINDKSATVGIVGLGYVGLPLAVNLAHAGYAVTGIDINKERVAAINRGESYIQDIAAARVAEQVQGGRLQAETGYDSAGRLDIIFICVPTPYNASKAPDISFIQNAAASIAPHLRREQLIVLQSTTYPGTTEEDVLPILESSRPQGRAGFPPGILAGACRPPATPASPCRTRPRWWVG